MSDLKQRTISSILYGTFLLLPMVLHPMGLVINMLFFLVLSCIEYFKLIQDQFKIRGKFIVLIYTLMTAALFLVIVYTFLFVPNYLLYISILSVLYSIILALRLYQLKFPFPTLLLNGLLYIGIPLSLWVCMGFIFDPYYPWFVIALISLIWANDVFAYLFGSAIGKRKLAPYISPGKTIEGSTAGIFCAIIWSLVVAYLDNRLPNAYWIGLSTIVAVAAIIGDLVESLFKRALRVKDSGQLIPGHGGILDRIDSMLFVIPFTVLYHFIYFGGFNT